MENESENLDSLNEENGENQEDDANALKEKNQKLSDLNRQLFVRAKKAEGFELKDNKWIKMEKAQEPNQKMPKEEKKTDELDYGQLAYLEAKQITTDEEIDFIKGVIKRTGESLKDVLKDEYVLNKLKSLRDAKAVLDATPSGTKGGAPSTAKDTVEYWIAKGEMPPADKPKLRQQYVNARVEKEKSGIKFYNS